MPFLQNKYETLKNAVPENVQIVAVSKTKPSEDILEAYKAGIRDFGENYVQELIEKQASLPPDIRWHFIGHLQSNKVKYIAPFVHLIHGVDSLKLLMEINKQGKKINRVIPCLLQVFIAREENKFGMDDEELNEAVSQLNELHYVKVVGLMGMASFSTDTQLIKQEFSDLNDKFVQFEKQQTPNFQPEILSMGMSNDYTIAIEAGSNMIRIGSMLFGNRILKSTN